ncbi:MAG: prolyl oligopeptidase family serine peptidase [Saprospiraceae bacterium]|nr:prolyl oligopeptidase family serine peptidase [Saprospiraceae bacterium]
MVNFEHSSITNELYTPDGITCLSLKSSNLRGRGEVTIYLPRNCRRQNNLPFIILLHGVYGSHFSWLFQAGAHLVLERMLNANAAHPFMLVMPSDGLMGDGTGYLPHKEGNYEKWIVEDVIEAINYHFDEITADSLSFISGLSMGGYGALRLGMIYPDLFSGISAHSAITDLQDYQTFIDEDFHNYLSPELIEGASILDIAILNRSHLPPFRFDCGDQDRLIESNRRLNRQLTDAGIPHDYREFPGIHNYEYWTEHIADSISFFSKLMRKRS